MPYPQNPDLGGVGWDPGFCILINTPDNSDAGCPATTFSEAMSRLVVFNPGGTLELSEEI